MKGIYGIHISLFCVRQNRIRKGKREITENEDMADKTEQRMTGLKYYTAVY